MKHSFCFFRGVLVFVCSQRRQGPSPKAVPAAPGWCSRAPLVSTPPARAVGRGRRRFPFPAPDPGRGNSSKRFGLRLPSPRRRRAPGWPGAAAPALLPQPDSPRGASCPRHRLPQPKATPRGLPLPRSDSSARSTHTQLLACRAPPLTPCAGGRQGKGGGRDGEGRGARWLFWPEHTCPCAASTSTIAALGSAARPCGTAAVGAPAAP